MTGWKIGHSENKRFQLNAVRKFKWDSVTSRIIDTLTLARVMVMVGKTNISMALREVTQHLVVDVMTCECEKGKRKKAILGFKMSGCGV